jgi:protein-tyrosine-phosphatase
MTRPRSVVFVCLHGSAKSLIAATLAGRLAAQRGLSIRFSSAGTEPDPAVPSHVAEGLLADGEDVTRLTPQLASAATLSGATLVVSFGPDVQSIAPADAAVEHWNDVPAVAEGYGPARDAIRQRVEGLLQRI